MIGKGVPAAGITMGVTLYRAFGDIEPAWRAMEAAGTATPYQRYDWQAAFAQTLGQQPGSEIIIATSNGEGGEPDLLLPLIVQRRSGINVASFLGDRQANFHMPVFRGNAPSFSGEQMLGVLREIARQHGGIDLFWFTHQPLEWNGRVNPLASIKATPSASQGYKLALDANPDDTLQRVLSKDTRKKSRSKLKKLEERGAVRHVHAQDWREIDTILTAFHAQKSDRFKQMGVDDPFAGDGARRFLEQASRPGGSSGRPAIDVHGLMCGDRVVSTLIGAFDGRRFSGMAISFDSDAEIARSSPGDLLLIEAIKHYARQGYSVFDLGIGEARYKDVFCEAKEQVVDGLIPITPRGALYAIAATRMLGAKRRIKQTPWMMKMVRKLGGLRTS